MKSDKRSRDNRRKDRRKNNEQDSSRPFIQAPVILERRDRNADSTAGAAANLEPPAILRNIDNDKSPMSAPPQQPRIAKPVPSPAEIPGGRTVVPFFERWHGKQPSDALLKLLGDNPGHFVVGIVGQQGVGKSTILSWFTHHPTSVFPVESLESVAYSRHQTVGIDVFVTPERTILLDTEPVLSCSVLDEALRSGSMDGLHPELWLERESLCNLVFMLSVCNVIIVVSEGTEIDTSMVKYLKRAELLKFSIPDFPLIPPAYFGQAQPEMNYYPDVVFVCNKSRDWEFEWQKYRDMQLVIKDLFADSNLRTSGLVSFGSILPAYNMKDSNEQNLFLLPYAPNESQQALSQPPNDIWNIYNDNSAGVESFETLVKGLREQVSAAPRRPGKKGQVSEKDWYRNAVKIHELIRKSAYISDYIKVAMRTMQK